MRFLSLMPRRGWPNPIGRVERVARPWLFSPSRWIAWEGEAQAVSGERLRDAREPRPPRGGSGVWVPPGVEVVRLDSLSPPLAYTQAMRRFAPPPPTPAPSGHDLRLGPPPPNPDFISYVRK